MELCRRYLHDHTQISNNNHLHKRLIVMDEVVTILSIFFI